MSVDGTLRRLHHGVVAGPSVERCYANPFQRGKQDVSQWISAAGGISLGRYMILLINRGYLLSKGGETEMQMYSGPEMQWEFLVNEGVGGWQCSHMTG